MFYRLGFYFLLIVILVSVIAELLNTILDIREDVRESKLITQRLAAIADGIQIHRES